MSRAGKIGLILGLLAAIVLLAAGCGSGFYGGDLKDLELVRGLIIDISENEGNMGENGENNEKKNGAVQNWDKSGAAGAAGEKELAVTALLLARDKALEGQYADSYYQVSGAGSSLAGAVGELYRRGARRLNFSHCQVLLLGEEAAGLANWLDWAQRSPEIRPTVYPVICRGRGQELTLGEGDISPLYWLHNILEPQGSSRPGPVAVRLQEFAELLLEPGAAPVLPLVALAGGEVRLAGFVVYGGERSAGSLAGDEGLGWLLLMRQDYLAGEVLDLAGRGALAIEAAAIGHEVRDGAPGPEVEYRLKLRLRAVENGENLTEAELAALAEERLQEIFAAAVARSRELGLDYLGAGREIRRRAPELWPELAALGPEGYLQKIKFRLVTELVVEDR